MTEIRPLIAHQFAPLEGALELKGLRYDYWFGANGVFIAAKRDHLFVTFRCNYARVNGLGKLSENLEFDLPKVPAHILSQMLTVARQWAIGNTEILFHLLFENDEWNLVTPEQDKGNVHCRPLQMGEGSSHQRAIIEAHSHHNMRAKFSRQDNLDETAFRIYGVFGNVLEEPEFRLRVGLCGYFWEIPYTWIFNEVEGLKDCVTYETEN